MEHLKLLSQRSSGFVRQPLLELLGHCQHYPLTLVLAPAGSGKSTLLNQWQAACAGSLVVHYGLQVRDNEPVRFFRQLAELVRAQVSDFDLSWFNPFADELHQSPQILGEHLADALNRLNQRLYLLLDDFHLITHSAINQVLGVVAQRLTGSVRLLVASRTHLGFSLSQLKLEHRLLRIDQHDLRLSRSEVQQLSQYLGGQPLSEEAVTTLMSLTEGWMAGVKVALLAHSQLGELALQRFSGSQPEIVDYFGHVVLRQLSEQHQRFFLSCAIFESFDGGICDQVLQRQGSALLLEELAARELFLLPVPELPGSYRFHALLHDFLSQRLLLTQSQERLVLHQRAAQYFAQRGEYDLALQHAQRGEDDNQLKELRLRACEHWVRAGHFAEVMKWLEPLGEAVLREQPRLCYPMILTLTLLRRFHQARYYLEEGILPDPQVSQVLALNLELFQYDLDFKPDQQWSTLLQAGVPLEARSLAQTILAYHHLMHGRLKRSMQLAQEAKALLARTGQHFLESYADLIIALGYRNAGRATWARKEVYEDYRRTSRQDPAWINRATAMVVALYEQNRLLEAQQLSEDLLAMVSSASATETISTVHVVLSRLLFRRKAWGQASRLLEQLSRVLQLGNYARFSSQLAQEILRQALLDGRVSQLELQAQRLGIEQRFIDGEWERTRDYDESWERAGLSAVYWLLGRGLQARAIRVLKVLLQSLRASEMRMRELVAEANLLVLEAPQCTPVERTQALQNLVERVGVVNINRSVFDEAPGFAELFFSQLKAGAFEVPASYCEAYGEYFKTPEQSVFQQDLLKNLTDKEAEIFACLLRGKSNSEISAELGIALSTTKWHLKNIYSKLHLSGRTDAILSMQVVTS